MGERAGQAGFPLPAGSVQPQCRRPGLAGIPPARQFGQLLSTPSEADDGVTGVQHPAGWASSQAESGSGSGRYSCNTYTGPRSANTCKSAPMTP